MSTTHGNMLLEAIEDDLTPVEIPVRLNGQEYILREASADAACKWRNEIMRCTKIGPSGRPESMLGTADSEPLLISLCLYKCVEHSSGKTKREPVSIKVIREWPSRIQKRLFDRIVNISGLRDSDVPDTEESLQEEITKLQARLQSIREEKNRKLHAGGMAPDGTPLSAETANGNSQQNETRDPNSDGPGATVNTSV